MKVHIFDVKPCAKEIIQVLEKYNATIFDMKAAFKAVKKDITLKTAVHTEYDANGIQ